MSSFIGHGIVGLSISQFSTKKPKGKSSFIWISWITFLAISPDLHYIALWTLGHQSIFKHSHSVSFAIILPILSVIFLKYKKVTDLKNKSLQLFIAPLSHLLLDLLVGVFPKAYLWPFYKEGLRLPFGILPSAGKLALNNYYFYKNLLIELGIILPFIGKIYLLKNRKEVKYFIIKQILLICIWIPFLLWGISLTRNY